ncbi:phage terminase small subunit [Ewingella americana]|uniref:Terminase n=1 Tax=Ewingella americana TaxID=41202 RepID=A0A502GIW6_9GAMM|nr:phage terminase small subunit [Ewingella americana]TPG61508.1 terminase [Ewingella americana]
MMSPAQRHSARCAAQAKLKQRQALDSSDSMHVMAAALEKDVEALHGLTLAQKVAIKRDTYLPRWMPTVEKYLAEGVIQRNPVLAWCVIWLFDVGDLDAALDLADIAIEQGQDTPAALKSNFVTFTADTVLAWAENMAREGQPIEPYFSRTFTNVTENWELYEVIRAKWFKFAGMRQLFDPQGVPRATATDDVELLKQVDGLLAQAHKLHSGCGVGTMRNQIASRVRALEKNQGK